MSARIRPRFIVSVLLALIALAVSGCSSIMDSMAHSLQHEMVSDSTRETGRYKKAVSEYERRGYSKDEAMDRADSDALWGTWDRAGGP